MCPVSLRDLAWPQIPISSPKEREVGMVEYLVVPRRTVGVKLFPARKQRVSVKAGGQVQAGWQARAWER